MFKNNIVAILFILLTLMQISISPINNVSNNVPNKILKNLNNISSMTYKIIMATYTEKDTNNDITIHYPQISNFNDNNKQAKINGVIKKEALNVLSDYTGSLNGKVTLDVDYDIAWQGMHVLSIKYYGYVNVERAAHPTRLFYTTNININNVSIIQLNSLINIDPSFVDKFKNGKFNLVNPDENDLLNKIMNVIFMFHDNLIDNFNNADTD